MAILKEGSTSHLAKPSRREAGAPAARAPRPEPSALARRSSRRRIIWANFAGTITVDTMGIAPDRTWKDMATDWRLWLFVALSVLVASVAWLLGYD